jgi:hypothetical protein
MTVPEYVQSIYRAEDTALLRSAQGRQIGIYLLIAPGDSLL